MIEKLREVTSAEVLQKPDGIEVLGINPQGFLFRGTTVEILTSTDNYVVSLRVEGTLFDGKINVFFNDRIMLNRMRHFDQDAYNKLFTLTKNQADAIEQIDDCKDKIRSYEKEFKEILSYSCNINRLLRG